MNLANIDEIIVEAKKLIAKLTNDRDHAIEHDNYGKACSIDGEIKGIVKVIRKLESGDLTLY